MNYSRGIMGGIIGGLVAAIPWVLMYVYGSMMLSFLAAVIGYGVSFGYKFFEGKIDKKLPMIITITSLSIVVFSMMVVIPMILIKQAGYPTSLENLQILYSDSLYMNAISKDLIISIIFTLIGISGIVKQTKLQVA